MAGLALCGTVALVTGASSGIGASTVAALAAEGCTVVAVARRTDRLAELVGSCADSEGVVDSMTADITEVGRAAIVVEEVVARHGRLDILVNNAGVMTVGPTETADELGIEAMVATNVTAVLTLSRAALPALLDAASGEPRGVSDIVNIGSNVGHAAAPMAAAYVASKFAITGASESLRQEFGGRFVRIGLVSPGGVTTEIASHMDPAILAAMAADRPAEPVGPEAPPESLDPSDVADAIVHMVTRRRDVAINEIVVRATSQVQ